MNVFLDSNIIIEVLRGNQALDPSLSSSINPIVYSEILYGFLYLNRKKDYPDRFLQEYQVQVLSIDLATARIYTKIKLTMNQQGTPQNDKDLLIAASCLQHQLTLWTLNSKHFEKIPQLKLHR